MCYTLSVYPSVPYLSHLLNMLTYHCANVPFNCRWNGQLAAQVRCQGGPLLSHVLIMPCLFLFYSVHLCTFV